MPRPASGILHHRRARSGGRPQLKRDPLGAFAPNLMSTESAPLAGAPSAPRPRKRWRWRRWALGAIVGAAAYATFEYPNGTLRSVGRDEYLEVLGAERLAKWESSHGRAQLLRVTFASRMRGFSDTATMWHESRLLFPFAESLAARTGDTIIELDHRWYPLTRMLPLRMDVWTYYHHERAGAWSSSTSLWH